ncbi:hypothetical protein NL676_003607 [Syzygium grande]|nr:hypothetical protein NL676_003607 [Syzygium grande]
MNRGGARSDARTTRQTREETPPVGNFPPSDSSQAAGAGERASELERRRRGSTATDPGGKGRTRREIKHLCSDTKTGHKHRTEGRACFVVDVGFFFLRKIEDRRCSSR